MAAKGILPPTILRTHYPLPVKHQPPISPLPDIPPFLSLLPMAGPELLVGDQVDDEKHIFEARADDDMTGKHGKMEPKRTCSTLKLSLKRAGTGVETPGQPRLLSRKTQQTAVGSYTPADGSLGLGRIVPLQVFVGVKPDTTSQSTARRKIVVLPMT